MEKLDYRIYFGDMRYMTEEDVGNGEVALIVTSPPYFNAPFDYPDLFASYDEYLDLIRVFAKQGRRVLGKGRICAVVTDDMLVRSGVGRGRKYPIVADTTKIFLDEGFIYRDRIVWVKPGGYTRISRRSGVILQHPYPMYFYPDNIQESILLFQNGEFDYCYLNSLSAESLSHSKVDVKRLNDEEWYLSVWRITNVLPIKGRLEEGIAAFPDEIPRRLIKLFSFSGETVFDPFLGSGTTLKVARDVKRKGIGYEIDKELKPVIMKKLGIEYRGIAEENFLIEEKPSAKNLRTFLKKKVEGKRSVVGKKR